MLRRCLLAALVCLGAADRARCVEFPYVAYVNSNDVYVRSGPGRNYYPTDKLQKGMQVEIYRHDPGGWYAIRPPQGSFSWISRRHLDAVDSRTAVVNTERAVARVGSAFSDVRDVIQVRLDKDEKVELLGPTAADSPWYKVAPPAGEFRWVFAKFVEREDGADPADDGSLTRASGTHSRANRVDLASAAQVPPSERPARRSPSRAAALSSEQERAREMAAIELDLSAMVVEEISAWSFVDLKRRAEMVLGEAQSSAERGEARALVSKLARFEDIKQRHDAVRMAGTEAPGATAAAASYRAVDPRFDGIGRLAPVISGRRGAPQFALVDASNTVVSFLTPAPGVNLRPYVDKQVGVNGQRGYMTDLQRQHINVQRVTLVDVERR